MYDCEVDTEHLSIRSLHLPKIILRKKDETFIDITLAHQLSQEMVMFYKV